VSTNINKDSTAVYCKMLTDAIKVNPDARPVVIFSDRNSDGQQCVSRVLGIYLLPPLATAEERAEIGGEGPTSYQQGGTMTDHPCSH
jgi:hypothetical protein